MYDGLHGLEQGEDLRGARVALRIVDRGHARDMIGLARIAAILQQQSHRFEIMRLRRDDQSGLAAAIGQIGVGADPQEQILAILEPDPRGIDERGVAVAILGVDRHALGEHELQPGQIATLGDDVQRGIAIVVATQQDRAGILVDRLLCLGAVTRFDRLDEIIGASAGELGGQRCRRHRHRDDRGHASRQLPHRTHHPPISLPAGRLLHRSA